VGIRVLHSYRDARVVGDENEDFGDILTDLAFKKFKS